MKNSFAKKLLKVNSLAFPFLVFLSYFFLFLETYTYSGFLWKHLFIDARIFAILVVLSAIGFSFYGTNNRRRNELGKLAFDINLLLLPILVIFYIIMIISVSTHYTNYVYATIHLQPDNFLRLTLFSLSVALISLFKRLYDFESKKNIKILFIANLMRKLMKRNFWFVVVVMLLTFELLLNMSNVLVVAIKDDAYIVTHLQFTYDQKMKKTWGLYYDYMKFIKEYTPSDATILIPPQSNHWLSTGNMGLDRYFLYPRNLIHGNLYDVPKSGYDYVLVAKGGWYNDAVDWGWPKVGVKAEKIWYIDPMTLSVTVVKEDFDPNNPFNMQAWGLIKVRKDVR